eukprot:1616217-Rhodomonas_salina.2
MDPKVGGSCALGSLCAGLDVVGHDVPARHQQLRGGAVRVTCVFSFQVRVFPRDVNRQALSSQPSSARAPQTQPRAISSKRASSRVRIASHVIVIVVAIIVIIIRPRHSSSSAELQNRPIGAIQTRP